MNTSPIHTASSSDNSPEYYFSYMSEFIGFTVEDSQAIRQSALVIEKNLPEIISSFYTNLLQYPPTRKFFLKKDGSIDEEYLQLRMLHQANFWRRAAGGEYDADFARFLDYVGRAHTSRGADKNLFIRERYVIGMVGFVQHAIIDAMMKELHPYDADLAERSMKAWNKLCMVILEMLSRAYHDEESPDTFDELLAVDSSSMYQMSVDSYEKGLGLDRLGKVETFVVAQIDEIPEGERKLVEIGGLSIGVFHHKGDWYALRNHCLHRGGPVATGELVGENLICPWHGYTYNITSGELLLDRTAHLERYSVRIIQEQVILEIPASLLVPKEETVSDRAQVTSPEKTTLKSNEFLHRQLSPGQVKTVSINGQKVAVYNVAGRFFASQEECTHAGGPLGEGQLEGNLITCPWHASCFNVEDGTVACPPAVEPLKTYSVVLDGGIARVIEKSSQ